MQNASCILSVFLKPWRGYPRACGVEALIMWWSVFVHLPRGSEMRAWELRTNLRHNEFLRQRGSWQGQAASSKQSGWVSGLGVSRQSQGQENGPSAMKHGHQQHPKFTARQMLKPISEDRGLTAGSDLPSACDRHPATLGCTARHFPCGFAVQSSPS